MRRTNGMAPRAIVIPSAVETTIVGTGSEGFINGGETLQCTVDLSGQPQGLFLRCYERTEPASGLAPVATAWAYAGEVSRLTVPARGHELQVTAAWAAGAVAVSALVSSVVTAGPRTTGPMVRALSGGGGALKDPARTIADAAAMLGAPYALVGAPFSVHNFARIWGHLVYTPGEAGAVLLFRWEVSGDGPEVDPTAITNWQPMPFEDGASFAATATGGQINVYGEECQLMPHILAGMPITFPVVVEGANWCRLMAYETAKVVNGTLEARWTGCVQ